MADNEKRQRGSITIEATIALTAYIFVIISILSFINICRAQMVVSLAVDATAKEMSEYSYFYGISGLESLADTLKNASGKAEDTTNQLIGYTKTMCTSLGGISGAVKDGTSEVQQGGQELGSADSLNAAINTVKKSAEELQKTGADISKNADALVGAATGFEKCVKGMDVEAYMRSLGALAANEGYHAILSRIICPALAKGMCAKHIEGYGNGDADAALMGMGISEGMDGLNFLMSDMFSDDHPTQIHLVCYYTVEFSNLVDLPGDTRMVFCKEAVTNAWLNGYYKKGSDEKK